MTRRFALAPARGWAGLRRRLPALLHAVDAVDLAVMPGEALALVGESGCGKSTLARLAARLLPLESGRILLDGHEVGATSPARFAACPLRRQVQMTFQDAGGSLAPHRTAAATIADPLRRLLPGLDRHARAARVLRAAAQVGLPPALLDRTPRQLSLGQQARVGLARALAVEPRVLVLDEPTAALDASLQAVLLQLLARLREETGTALLVATHDLHVARLLCDRVAVMGMGQILETGPTAAVLRAPAHPVTRALLAALPRLPAGVPQPLPPSPAGDTPAGVGQSPVDPPPQACRLHGRCPRQTGRCATEAPPLRPVAPDHLARCHHPATATPP